MTYFQKPSTRILRMGECPSEHALPEFVWFYSLIRGIRVKDFGEDFGLRENHMPIFTSHIHEIQVSNKIALRAGCDLTTKGYSP
jgi:hypothetical protein